MKKVLGLVLAVVLMLSLFVGVAPAEGEKSVTIGVSFGTLQQEHWVKSRDIIERVAAELGCKVIVQSADDDMTKQINQCENMITQGIDVLVLVALDTEAAAPIVQTAHEAKVPVVGYVRAVQNCDVDYFCGTETREVGVMQAQYALSVAPKGKYVLIEGAPADINARYIYEGQMSVLQPAIDSGDVTVVSEQWCDNWDPSEALRYIEDAMTANNNDIQFLMTANDAAAGAALTVLTEQNLQGKILTTGIDCDLSACQRIVGGTQGMTGFLCYPYMADMLTRAVIQLVRTGDISEYVTASLNNGYKDVPFINGNEFQFCVNKDTMAVVYNSGWHDVNDIYANIPKEEWPAEAVAFAQGNK